MKFIFLILISWGISNYVAAQSPNISRTDLDSIKRVCLFKLLTGEELLKTFGINNIEIREVYDNEGDSLSGKNYILFPNTNDEVTVYIDKEEIINLEFGKPNNNWKLPFSLYVGMSIEEIIKINGKDFSIYGFEWDYAGQLADWKGGKLKTSGVIIIFETPPEINLSIYFKYRGDREFSTSDKGLKSLHLFASKIIFKK
jgi:hypothetical protein